MEMFPLERNFKTALMESSLEAEPREEQVDMFHPESSFKTACIESSLGRELPEEMVEMIMARVQFPFIFKSRALSREWLSRFSLSKGPGTEESSSMQRWFHKEVASVSEVWPKFSPVFVIKNVILGYDGVAKTWFQMETHRSSPRFEKSTLSYHFQVLENTCMSYTIPVIIFAGALMCHITSEYPGYYCKVIVANVITGEARYLPHSPISPNLGIVLGQDRMFHATADGYQILLVQALVREPRDEMGRAQADPNSIWIHLQLYSSSCEAWSSKEIRFGHRITYHPSILMLTCSVFSHGRVFVLFFHDELAQFNEDDVANLDNTVENSSLSLWSYDIHDQAWKRHSIHPAILQDYFVLSSQEVLCKILQCGSRIFMMDYKDGIREHETGEDRERWSWSFHIRVSEFNPQTQDLTEVSTSPPILKPSTITMEYFHASIRFAADDERLFIWFAALKDMGMHVYQVADKWWTTSSLPPKSLENLYDADTWVQSKFSPGSMTFSVV